jgi:hypothetical protein
VGTSSSDPPLDRARCCALHLLLLDLRLWPLVRAARAAVAPHRGGPAPSWPHAGKPVRGRRWCAAVVREEREVGRCRCEGGGWERGESEGQRLICWSEEERQTLTPCIYIRRWLSGLPWAYWASAFLRRAL